MTATPQRTDHATDTTSSQPTTSAWVVPGPGWLFCPADRPERFAKAARAADVVILDLEDAVSASDKAAARQAILDEPQPVETTVIRINSVNTASSVNTANTINTANTVKTLNAGNSEHFEADLSLLARTSYRRVMLPKAESREQLERLGDYDVIAQIESPLGALNVASIASAPNCVGLTWGSEDLTAGLGGRSSRLPDGAYHPVIQSVRAACLVAAKAHGAFALDAVFTAIPDQDGLRAEALDAVSIGFDAKAVIHPTQVDVVRQAFVPSDEEMSWASRLLEAAQGQRGVFSFEGTMVDGPVFAQAQQILRRARAARE